MKQKIQSKLTDVPETMLWTLHNRAGEASRKDGVIKDQKCIAIYSSIDYDFERSFGRSEPSHGIRSAIFDAEIRKFLKENPAGTIVNLGEGLETQRFRIEGGGLWVTVDLPSAIEIRERFIQPDAQHIHGAFSVLDRKWFDLVPKDKPVFITAQGLFMYLEEDDIKGIFTDIFDRFPTGYLMFDTIPKWISKKTISEKGWMKTPQYKTPRMPWGINRHDIKGLKKWSSHIKNIEDIPFAFPRGVQKWVAKIALNTPLLNNLLPSVVKLEFGA